MKIKSATVSAIVIAKNEESRIWKCLSSLSWTDEQIVVDNGSSDETLKAAEEAGAKVWQSHDLDFSKLRNIGKEKSSGKWILYIDADEIVPEALRQEIQTVITSKDSERSSIAFFVKRRNYYLGKPWPYQDKMERLFLKEALVRWVGQLHERPIVHGSVGVLTEPLVHNTHRTLEEMVEKTNEWSEIEAKLRFQHHHPSIVRWRLLRVMMTGFYESFIRQGGWKAGTPGWVESIYQAFSMFITYAKLWELQQSHYEHDYKSNS